MGIAVCGSGLGTLVFSAVMPYVINAPLWFDYRGALPLEAVIIFICVIFGAAMIPLPQEPSEIRRVERKARRKAKQQVFKTGTATSQSDEQQKKLLPTNQKSLSLHIIHQWFMFCFNDTPSQEVSVASRESIAVVHISQECLSDDAAFALFVISNVLTNLGFYVLYNFAHDLAADAKVIEHKRHWIIMSIVICTCFGRVIIGYLADRSWVNRLILYNITLIIAGIATMFAPFCNYFVQTHMTYAGLFGFFSGGYVDLISTIIVDLVGVDKLSDALDVLLLFQGFAVVIGTPIVGTMRDAFSGSNRSYFWLYLIFGGSILLSGLILFGIPVLKRRKELYQQPTKHQLQMGVLSFSNKTYLYLKNNNNNFNSTTCLEQ
ncbi:unnamed protein product [Rotaria sp. Silwood1]|nr:unnamed protein product [Rotaria sp. Silwood1]